MKIAYVKLRAFVSEWPDLCKWLDYNCRGWTLANRHSADIEKYRTGRGLGFSSVSNILETVKVTDEQGTIIKLFHPHAEIRWCGEEMSCDERMIACQMSEYNGHWREFPAELLGESTIGIIKNRVRELNCEKRDA